MAPPKPPSPKDVIENPERSLEKITQDLRPVKDTMDIVQKSTDIFTTAVSLPYEVSEVLFQGIKRR